MTRRLTKLTAFILAIILSLPFAVFATAQDEQATNDGTDIVYELTELRNEFEKHYLMSDGTVVAATYAEPVNYYDKTDGKWKEIDNSLSQVGGRYRNKGHGGFDVSFRGDSTSGDLVEITVDEHTLSWSVSVQNESGVKDTVKAQANAAVKQKDNKKTDKFAVDKASSGMRYNSPFSGNKIIDVDYTVSQYKVKEDITIYSSKDANVLQYTYNCGSLTAVLNRDNSISFLDEAGEAVYTVHKPYMYDSAGNGSYDFNITLKQRGSVCTVVMVPDKEWLDTAVYPVVIDPTVTNNKATSNYSDTYIHSGDSAGDHSSETTMNIGKFNGVQNCALIKIGTFPTTPSNANVLGVQFVLHLPAGSTSGGPFTLKHVSTSWSESTVCYNNRPTASTVINSSVPADFGALTITFDITSHYNMIKAGTRVNNGFWIENTDTTLNDFNSPYTSNCGNSSLFPVVQIRYTPIRESESNNTFATADELELQPQPGITTSVSGSNSTTSTTTDYDYYKFVAPRHGRVEVTLTVFGDALYSLAIYNEDQSLYQSALSRTAINYPDGTVNKECEISFTATKDGDKNGSLDTYYLRVFGPATDSYSYGIYIKYTTAYAALDWQYPLPTNWVDASSPAGTRYRNNKYEYHEGLDLPANSGVDVFAVADGYVYRSRYDGSMGNYVTLYTAVVNTSNLTIQSKLDVDPFNTDASFVITYMHMYEIHLTENTHIEKGQKVGRVGTTGESTGNHLHIGIFSSTTLPSVMTANLPTDVINPYDFFYNTVSFTGNPY